MLMHWLMLWITNKGTKKQPLLNAYALAVVASELSFRAGGQLDRLHLVRLIHFHDISWF